MLYRNFAQALHSFDAIAPPRYHVVSKEVGVAYLSPLDAH